MYKITIKTRYNIIVLETDDYNTPQMQEILEQPYVKDVQIEEINNKTKKLTKNK